jgi:hypothetical protein
MGGDGGKERQAVTDAKADRILAPLAAGSSKIEIVRMKYRKTASLSAPISVARYRRTSFCHGDRKCRTSRHRILAQPAGGAG